MNERQEIELRRLRVTYASKRGQAGATTRYGGGSLTRRIEQDARARVAARRRSDAVMARWADLNGGSGSTTTTRYGGGAFAARAAERSAAVKARWAALSGSR